MELQNYASKHIRLQQIKIVSLRIVSIMGASRPMSANSSSLDEKPQNWDDYRYFLATVEGGNFSAAARILNVSQPTVSRRIAQMEQNLGVRLFDQHPEGYVLTHEGHQLIEIANQLRERARALQRRAVGLQAAHSGTVKLTTTEGLAQYWLPRHVPDFCKLYPEIQIKILAGAESLDLLRNQADIALRFGDPGSRELVGRRVGLVSFCLFASQDYLNRHGEPKHISDLHSHSFVGATGSIGNFSQNLQLVSVLKENVFQSSANSVNVQLGLAQAGLGIVCLPCYMANCATLDKILPDEFNHEVELWILTHKDIRHTPRVRVLLDFLYGNLRKDLESLER